LLIDNNVHIWSFKIPAEEEKFKYYSTLLSEDEIERAQRFHFQKDRNEYVCCRGFLRETLGSYLGISPDEIIFDYGQNGKPELVNSSVAGKIKFNLSHSKEYAVLALTHTDEIGVDIELIKNIPEMFDIAQELYTENENDLLKNASDESKNIFFRFWTRKEAIIKAVGKGLSAPLKMIDVSSDNSIVIDRSFENHSKEFEGCRLIDLTPPAGYKAAVAVFGNIKEISYFTVQ
jgi:4'-phosphopantetheinyl transferase